MRTLLVRLSSIGDVIHTLPALAALREAGHVTGWLVEPAGAGLLRGNPALDHLFVAPPRRAWRPGAALATLRSIRAAGFDAALDLAGLWKSAAWARLSGARRVVGFAGAWRREPASRLLLGETAAPPDAVGPHVVDKNLALLRTLGIEAVGTRRFPLPPLAAAAAGVEEWLASLTEGPIALLNPGGGWAGKLWPPEAFGALARRLRARGLVPLVSWGPGEEALAQRVVSAAAGDAVTTPATTLLELAALARRAAVVVACDTGPLHLACALGTPVVAVFGPTDPRRNGPFDPRDVIVRHVPACAPCYRRRCHTHDRIMADITVDEVARAVEQRLTAREERVRAV